MVWWQGGEHARGLGAAGWRKAYHLPLSNTVVAGLVTLLLRPRRQPCDRWDNTDVNPTRFSHRGFHLDSREAHLRSQVGLGL